MSAKATKEEKREYRQLARNAHLSTARDHPGLVAGLAGLFTLSTLSAAVFCGAWAWLIAIAMVFEVMFPSGFVITIIVSLFAGIVFATLLLKTHAKYDAYVDEAFDQLSAANTPSTSGN
jgi:hypothetical protein